VIQIFISNSNDDADLAKQIRQDLEARGYSAWKDIRDSTPASLSYPRAIENGIQGSRAIVVVWSGSAAKSEWVEREILFAQRLQKPIFPIMIDETDLPITLINAQSITSKGPHTDVVEQLMPHLQQFDRDDKLNALASQLTHDYIRIRKDGIERAAELLKKGVHREEILAMLENIALNDLIMGVREKAQAVLDADAKKEAQQVPEGQSRHMFGARCPNGHVTYFDKRKVCPNNGILKRSVVRRGGTDLDEIYLKCGTPGCGAEMVVSVDCEGYK
jgi:hypothetical protein